MIQRILQVKYDMPKHISPECADLLRRILVSDPNKRLTIPQIQDHPWYLKDLPPGVKEMNNDLRTPTAGLQSTDEIMVILQEAQKTPAALANGAEQDAYIDDALQDEAVYESSFDDQWAEHVVTQS